MFMANIKLFNKTCVGNGIILNVTTLIIKITDIFKIVMNPGTAKNVAAQFFLLDPSLSSVKNFRAVAPILIASLCVGKN